MSRSIRAVAAPRPAHPLPIRIMHWVGAAAILCMMFSGWAIYNASPSLGFTFPRSLTLGHWLAAGIAWHISAMWVLFADGLGYLAYGFASGHFARDIFPRGPAAVARDLADAFRLRLGHRLGAYNAVQRLLYAGVLVIICLAVATGLAIWKSVQFGWLTELFGGYPIARGLHLAMMFAILAFVLIHVALVALYPRTLVAMIAGTPAEADEAAP